MKIVAGIFARVELCAIDVTEVLAPSRAGRDRAALAAKPAYSQVPCTHGNEASEA
jgi:hypothetical protein